MKNKKILGILAILLLTGLLIAYPINAGELVYTEVHFIVPVVVAFSVTLPGENAVESSPSGSATTSISFNASNSGNAKCVEACVIGGSCQDSATPIYDIVNIGTVKLNFTININATTPACITTFYMVDTYTNCSGTVITTTNSTLKDNVGPGESFDVWIQTNFSNCDTSADTWRRFNIYGYEA